MKLQMIRSSVPDTAYPAAKMAPMVGAEEEFIREKVGVETKYILGADETGIDLAHKAAQKLLSDAGLAPEDIDFLIYVTQTPEYKIPQNSALLHDRLGLRSDCGAYDISLGCSGWVYAALTALAVGDMAGLRNVMVVTCDPYSKIMDPSDKGTAAVFGDGATASLFNNADGGYRFGKFDFGTAGDKFEALIIPASGAAKPVRSWHSDGVNAYESDDVRLHMKGREVFNFVQTAVPVSVRGCLEKNDMEFDDIGCFALHQGSKYMLSQVARRMRIPAEKLPINIEKYGNTVSSSVPMLLEDVMSGRIDVPAGPILTSGFGVGLSWATTILHAD